MTPCSAATSRICCVSATTRETGISPSKLQPNAAMMLPRSTGNARRLVHLHDRMLPGELLRGGAVLIADGKFLRGAELDGAGIGEAVGKLQRALKTFLVEPQRGVFDARSRREPAHHVFGVGHAGYVLRVDEGDDLDAVKPGLRQRVDQFDLARGRNRAFLDLKAFARPFFGDVHGGRQIAHEASPAATTPRLINPPISPAARPSSARISPVCSPMRGACRRRPKS